VRPTSRQGNIEYEMNGLRQSRPEKPDLKHIHGTLVKHHNEVGS
jgi:hypothetical protein